jgi:hypothetical protein
LVVTLEHKVLVALVAHQQVVRQERQVVVRY